jgi:hypothetical protein
MDQHGIQYISDEEGNPTGVIPIDPWHEIISERDGLPPQKEAMKQRLLQAKNRRDGIPFEVVREKLEFDLAAFEDLLWWADNDRQKALRILRLIQAVQRDPFRGIATGTVEA